MLQNVGATMASYVPCRSWQHIPAYKVDSLPKVPFGIGEMHSGLVPINYDNTSGALFFVFQPSIREPVDEITIWLNGGSGKAVSPRYLSIAESW